MKYENTHRRAIANFIDTMIIGIPVFLIGDYFLNGGAETSDLLTVISFIFFNIYMIITEGIYGQSLGKKIFKLKVLKENRGKCDFKSAAVRNLLRIIDALPNLYIVGILVITFTKKHQRIGDLAAKTVVVRESEEKS